MKATISVNVKASEEASRLGESRVVNVTKNGRTHKMRVFDSLYHVLKRVKNVTVSDQRFPFSKKMNLRITEFNSCANVPTRFAAGGAGMCAKGLKRILGSNGVNNHVMYVKIRQK